MHPFWITSVVYTTGVTYTSNLERTLSASIILPVHNQADHIQRIVRAYKDVLANFPLNTEIILVPNGCTDDSLVLCERLAVEDTSIRVIPLEKNGWGRAVRAGLDYASGEILAYTNCARTSPEDLLLLLGRAMRNPGTLVKANRRLRYTFYRRLASMIYNLQCRALFNIAVWDVNGTPKVFPRSLLQKVSLQEDGDLIDLELCVACDRLNVPILEIPTIRSVKRYGGISTTGIISAWKMYLGALRLHKKTLALDMPATTAQRHTRDAERFRNPAEVIGSFGGSIDSSEPRLLSQPTGRFWEILSAHKITLLVSREYEHLLLSLTNDEEGKPQTRYLEVPHPSGIAVAPDGSTVVIASTRNPNQLLYCEPVRRLSERDDFPMTGDVRGAPLVPTRIDVLPGCMYIHDLAYIGTTLHANAVGENAVIRINENSIERAWWPKCIETQNGPVFDKNHLQLNSIAPGSDIASSFFSASSSEMLELRPGDAKFPVDRRGVIFSGATREPIAFGLTRPHSARLHNDTLWVDNSGYGEVGIIQDGKFQIVQSLPGWTRGLAFHDGIAFIGTSRVLPRFQQYAPGLDIDASVCGVHAVDCESGEILGSIVWPSGNQIFAVELIPSAQSCGFPCIAGKPVPEKIFYSFQSSRFT